MVQDKNNVAAAKDGDAAKSATRGNDQESGLAAEQESAAAMDADVPQPADASETTEGQPS